MTWTAQVAAALVAASAHGVQAAPQAVDPAVAADSADTARLNAKVKDAVHAQIATIRRSQEDHARSQAAFAAAQSAYEEAKRRNDAERAEAAANAAAYQRDMAAWRTRVAEVEAHNAGLKSRAPAKAADPRPEPPRSRVVCTMETATGSNMPRRVCRPAGRP